MKNSSILISIVFLSALQTTAQKIISEKKISGAFPVAAVNEVATILYDSADDSLIQIVANLLAKDVEMVSGNKPGISTSVDAAKNVILIGSIGRSAMIQELIKGKKLNVTKLQNKWEAYQIQVIKAPFKGVDQALVIAGSDRRGAAYGALELSEQMGISPWYWWADVPVKKKKEIYITTNALLSDAPKVKYRGIFLNDEAPALSGWSKEKFGGFNHQFYEKVFELILRLKGNYLWPAMWGNAFNDDDKLNPVLADKWGIVMGTSHHEPLLRAQQEWRRYGKGAWDYTKNDSMLRSFWRNGMVNMGDRESIVTIGMRGDGDEPMTQGTAIELLERIVTDQRKIISDVTGKPANETPQLWALYKEVQDYYDKGMRVPDDVTLLLCDDNWGNLRKLPKLTDKPRSGGYGIYYHFDYVGGPRNYKWLNTNNIARVWEQMNLAYRHGVDKIWIVNVGDLKPMEFPISFFLDFAWNPDQWNEDNLRSYYTQWAADQFGEKYQKEIGEILRRYAQYSSRRKPELLDANTYSLTNYNEAERVLNEWRQLLAQAEKVSASLPAAARDAFFQVALHHISALANLHEMYVAVAKNKLYAAQNLPAANEWADKAKQFYINDSLITIQYHTMNGGKWNHMMSQTHIGYTYWQQPPVNKMPEVKYVTAVSSTAITPVALSPSTKITDANVVSIEAQNWTRKINAPSIQWKTIPDIGKTASGITTFPVTASTQLTTNSMHVEYDFSAPDTGNMKLSFYFSPTLNFHNTEEGLEFAISVDNETPQIISLNKEDKNSISGIWNQWVANNIIIKTSTHKISKRGRHTVKYWMISPGVILQKLVIDFGGLKPSYLGPPETGAK
jgi:hypothetical protein